MSLRMPAAAKDRPMVSADARADGARPATPVALTFGVILWHATRPWLVRRWRACPGLNRWPGAFDPVASIRMERREETSMAEASSFAGMPRHAVRPQPLMRGGQFLLTPMTPSDAPTCRPTTKQLADSPRAPLLLPLMMSDLCQRS